MRVLIADDSSLVRERLCAALSEIEGIEIVGQTPDAQIIVDFVRRLSPEVVVMDIRLRGGNGIDALRTIKRGVPAPIVLVFTNYAHAEYREKCMDAGADFFFAKSSEFKVMLKTLRAFLKTPLYVSAS
ncbi:MAG: response regulator transcription factor [Acidobacteriota bacterium]|nr:response regulator transcription factor [Acidobacteriota bacterium]